MIGVPFKPLLIDVIENQCGEFNVTWGQSAKDSGGGSVTGFQVQMRRKHDDWRNCSAPLTNHSCLCKNIQSETKYDIRVQALNQKGASDWANRPTKSGFIGKCTQAHTRDLVYKHKEIIVSRHIFHFRSSPVSLATSIF